MPKLKPLSRALTSASPHTLGILLEPRCTGIRRTARSGETRGCHVDTSDNMSGQRMRGEWQRENEPRVLLRDGAAVREKAWIASD